jgi:hypothetical protein
MTNERASRHRRRRAPAPQRLSEQGLTALDQIFPGFAEWYRANYDEQGRLKLEWSCNPSHLIDDAPEDLSHNRLKLEWFCNPSHLPEAQPPPTNTEEGKEENA